MGNNDDRQQQETENLSALPDASETPDYDAVEQTWETFLAQDETGAVVIDGEVRATLGLGTPSSVVGSAEGMAQFQGIRINGNGRLDDVHTQLLSAKIGELDVAKLMGKMPPPEQQ